ncbi:putative terpene synthase 9 [Camellia lanceoleosa]|uniref:Terpene synthase 9 n=1 Tax=Camellia lanceoleosa TaxID=1840588 RepID=A0ACC0HFE8_9ERIC|nr:putative terpene synthase 9 [Camellia lanceoleosa]
MELVSSYHCPSSFTIVRRGMVFQPQQQWTIMATQSPSPPLLIKTTNKFEVNPCRSANYHPSIWDSKIIESMNTLYTYELYGTKLEELKQETRRVLQSTRDHSSLLKLIDSMQRLGVSYHYEEEIEEAISDHVNPIVSGNLYTTALHFRLLRQHGYPINSDVFNKFKDGSGRFMDSLREDVTGLVSLYEATHLRMDGEDDFEEAYSFSTKHLNSSFGKMEIELGEQVKQSLEIPLHWRMPRLEARNSIDLCLMEDSKPSVLLKFAKLDYNLVQSVHQQEVQELSKWDLKAMEELPEYMKICYLAMFNFGNEIAYDVLKNHGLDVLSYIKEQWTNLCRSYLVEARWFYSGYTPTLDEYLDNSWTSVGGPAAITHAYLMLGFPLTLDSLDGLKISSDTIYWASLITRLSDDLGTSKDEIERGDVAKSIHCCMIKEGVSEEEARDRIKALISFSWKKLNEATAKINHRHHPARSIVTMSLNMARSQSIFQHGDGIGTSIGITKDRLTSLIVKPIPIPIQHVNHQAMLQEPNLLLVAM